MLSCAVEERSVCAEGPMGFIYGGIEADHHRDAWYEPETPA